MFGQRALGFGKNAYKIFLDQVHQFHANREPPLQFGHQIAGTGAVKSAGGHEEDVIGPDHSIPGLDSGTFDDGQEVPLDSLPRNVGAAAAVAGHNLVQLIQKNDADIFGQFDCLRIHLVLVNQRLAFFFEQDLTRLGHGQFPLNRMPRHDFFEHALQVEIHLFATHVGEHQRDGLLLGADLDKPVFHLPRLQHGSHFFPSSLVPFSGISAIGSDLKTGWRRGQQIDQPVLHPSPCLAFHLPAFPFADQSDGIFHQLADHALHVAAVIPDFRILGRFHLDEGGPSQPGQPPRDLGFAHARGADHEDVLGRHFGPHFFRQLLASPAVANGYRHGPLGIVLTDNMAIQLFDNLPRS